MDAASEVKSRINIEDVVSEYVQLKRAGRNFKGLSPFTNENTPSFIVSPEKQIWHDFSSGKGGDVISFIEQIEGLDFKGSLELLARKAGVDLSSFKQSNSLGNKSKERLFEAVESAVSYYQVQLTKNTQALKYVREERGYEKQTLIDFRFGFAPNSSDTLAQYLKSKGFSEQELLTAGLCIKRDSRLIDMFRGRIMIPLSDAQGRSVGFTARQLSEDKNSPKYINTSSTILYDKSRQLFGFAQAKEHIRKTGFVVVVEGNLDVVASHQAGVKNVVASAGTALTSHHLKSLHRFTGDVRLAFDEDRAGQEAAERIIPLAQSLDIELSFVAIPSGKDPDELIKQDVKKWQEVVESPQYMVDWLIDRISETTDLSTAPGKRQFTTKVLEIIRKLQDGVEQEHYIKIVADVTKTSVESIQKKFSEIGNSPQVRLKQPNISKASGPVEDKEQRIREQHFIAIMLSVPEFRTILNKIPMNMFSQETQDLMKRSDNLADVKKTDDYVKMLSLLFEETYQHTDHEELNYQTKHLMRRLVEFYIRTQKSDILKQLETADETEEKRLLTKVNELEQIKHRIITP